MASLRDIRRRIGSIRNIAQITRAMEMVAASRMKRAQESILAARPFAEELDDVLARVAAAVEHADEPLLARRPVKHVALVMITTDRGLAGALNSNAVRNALRWIAERGSGNGQGPIRVSAITVGRKGRDALRRAGIPIAAHFPQFGDRPVFADVQPLAKLVTEDFLAETYDEVVVSYSSFISTLVQRPAIKSVLPVHEPTMTVGQRIRNDEYLFEPSAEVLSRLLPYYVAVDIYRAVLENIASEQSARMIAMRNSTDNANELIGELTLVYNKTRQATITREMIE
ncbi:MAG TPA: ATP synthase F1 subunit gamma, partial [Candidatus Limnocylindria bacterium]|nr:ATP synthase F1 subunit gamma [Candidatus Limnocylindria bacterium]